MANPFNYLKKLFDKSATMQDPKGAAQSVEVDSDSARTLLGRGEIERVLHRLQVKLEREPDRLDLHQLAVSAWLRSDRPSRAQPHLSRLLRAEPENSRHHFALARMNHLQGQFEPAYMSYQKVLALDPQHIGALINVGILDDMRGAYDKAEAAFSKAVTYAPEDADAHYNLATLLQHTGQLERAHSAFTTAVSLNSKEPQYLAGLGGTATLLGRWDEAQNHLEAALKLEPDSAEIQYTFGLLQLTLGNHKTGWQAHEYGLRTEQRRTTPSPLPRWSGEPLHSARLLVLAEQGLGDEIMFASCLPDIQGRPDLGSLTIQCDPRLLPLFKRSFHNTTLLPRPTDPSPVAQTVNADHDLQIAAGSLPAICRLDETSFPQRERYLYADFRRKEIFRKTLLRLGPGLKVGVTWRGGATPRTQHFRTVPLSQWAPVFETPGVIFVSLQYGDTNNELETFNRSSATNLHRLCIDCSNDIDGLASLIDALDLIISVDNSTVHLAGALGTETWVLLPKQSDWRWMSKRTDTPWYAALSLYRNSSATSWCDLMYRAAADLQHRAGSTA